MTDDDTPGLTKADTGRLILRAMRERGLTYADLAQALDVPRLWLAAAVGGQHPFPSEAARSLVATLGLSDAIVPVLEEVPMRGALDSPVPSDPTIYRLYEVLQVYGPALKALIHEEFGDGIMSAINFRADVERVADPGGDRGRITLDGKFLPYQWG